MLSDADIIQAVVGSTGSVTKLQGVQFDITLPTPCTAGNGIIIVGCSDNANVTKPTGFSSRLAADGTVGTGSQFDWTKQAEGGEDTFTIDLIDVDGCAAWCVLEVQGLESLALDESGVPVAFDERTHMGSNYSGGGLNSLASGPGSGPGSTGDCLIIASAATMQFANVTPKTITSLVDTVGGQSGTWARPGATTTIATNRVGGGPGLTNVRLDVFCKYPEGESHLIDATATWSTPPDPEIMSVMVLAFNAFWVPSQQTMGRAAPGSMTAF